MKMKLPKLRNRRVGRKLKTGVKSLGSITLMSIIAALIISVVFLAFPRTELISTLTRYDLKVKDSDWKNIYRISTTEQDSAKLENMRNILSSRLEKFGIEQFTISQPMDQGDSTKVIQIDVQSSKDTYIVTSLLNVSGEIKFLEPKEGVDFNTVVETDPTAIQDPNAQTVDPKTDINNYTETSFNRNFFRNIEVTKTTLQDASGNKQDSFIGIFKTWVADTNKFKDFINNHLGKIVGMEINGQVASRTISTNDTTMFFLQLGTTDLEAQYYDIIFNSGVINSTFTLEPEEKSTPVTFQVDYEKSTIAFLAGIVLLTVFIAFNKKSVKKGLHFLLSTSLVISLYICYYKLSLDPILLYFISIVGIFTVLLNLMITFEIGNIRFVIIGTSVLLLLAELLSLGNISWLSRDLLLVTLSIVPISYLSKLYITKLNRALLR